MLDSVNVKRLLVLLLYRVKGMIGDVVILATLQYEIVSMFTLFLLIGIYGKSIIIEVTMISVVSQDW